MFDGQGRAVTPTRPVTPPGDDPDGANPCAVCRSRPAAVHGQFELVCQKATSKAKAKQGLEAICSAIAQEQALQEIATKLLSLPQAKLDAFLSEITETTTDTDALSQNISQLTGELIDTWNTVRYAVNSRKSIAFLKWLKTLNNHPDRKEVIDWHIMYTFAPSEANEFFFHQLKEVTGCHYYASVDGNYVRFIGTPVTNPTTGVLKCDIEIYKPQFSPGDDSKVPKPAPVGWSWKKKYIPNGFEQTFFPVSWTKQQIIEQTASALANSTRNSVSNSMYEALSESGVTIRWVENPNKKNINNIASFFPKF